MRCKTQNPLPRPSSVIARLRWLASKRGTNFLPLWFASIAAGAALAATVLGHLHTNRTKVGGAIDACPAIDGVLTATIVDPTGGLVRSSKLKLTAHLNEDTLAPLQVVSEHSTDDAGVLRLPIGNPSKGLPKSVRKLKIESVTLGGAEVSLPQPIPESGLDLGEIRLTLRPVVAAGRVVDQEGNPIADVRVRLTPDTRSEASPEKLMAAMSLGATTDSHGHFVIRGECDFPEFGLHSELAKHAALDSPRVRRGQADVEIVMARSGAMEGSLQFGPNDQRHDFRVALRSTASEISLTGRINSVSGSPPVASFAFDGVLPGTYSLLVSSRAVLDDVLVSVDGVVIKAGEVCRDSRVQGIALPSTLKTIHLTVTDERGSALDSAVAVAAQSRQTTPMPIIVQGGKARIRFSGNPFTLAVRGTGYTTHIEDGVQGDTTIRLRSKPKVQIEIAGWKPPEVVAGRVWSLRVIPIQARAEWPMLDALRLMPSEAPLDAKGRATVSTGFGGEARAQLVLTEGQGPGARRREATLDPTSFTIDDQLDLVTIGVRLTSEALNLLSAP